MGVICIKFVKDNGSTQRKEKKKKRLKIRVISRQCGLSSRVPLLFLCKNQKQNPSLFFSALSPSTSVLGQQQSQSGCVDLHPVGREWRPLSPKVLQCALQRTSLSLRLCRSASRGERESRGHCPPKVQGQGGALQHTSLSVRVCRSAFSGEREQRALSTQSTRLGGCFAFHIFISQVVQIQWGESGGYCPPKYWGVFCCTHLYQSGCVNLHGLGREWRALSTQKELGCALQHASLLVRLCFCCVKAQHNAGPVASCRPLFGPVAYGSVHDIVNFQLGPAHRA